MGFHRFYLGRIGSGILYFFTGGLFGFGALFDLFYMPSMVRQENLRSQYRDALTAGTRPARIAQGKESAEKTILRVAKKNRGVVTPGEVAIEGDVSIDEAKDRLEQLVSKGHAEMRVKKSGIIVYYFGEFSGNGGYEDFEEI